MLVFRCFILKWPVFFGLLGLLSCHDGPTRTLAENEAKNKIEKTSVSILQPLAGTTYRQGSEIAVRAFADTSSAGCDSLELLIGNVPMAVFPGNHLEYTWKTEQAKMGKNRIVVRCYAGGLVTGSAQTLAVILSSVPPRTVPVTVVRKYPHDSLAYTQGLYYENGYLYESTGQYKHSSLRKVRMVSGEIEQSYNLPDDVFGEGLAVFDGKILQLSWKNKMAFLYDKKSFQLLRNVQYPIDEGWGLTWDSTYFWMSDGSEKLYKMHPESFSEAGEIEVYDHEGAVSQLNELEFIRGKLFANVYGKPYIVIIDPATGRVAGKMDFSFLIPERYKNNYDKVLNGIAWNPENGHLLITGKEWPWIYEIQFSF